MARHTRRSEMRADREALISLAAAAQHMSVSAFVVDAAAGEASRVLSCADLTLVPAEAFEALVGALDQADAAPRLAAAAAGRHRYQRR